MLVIVGAVEKVDADSVIGWARASQPNEAVHLEVLLGGVMIGEGCQITDRPDLGGKFGFHIKCSAAIYPINLAAGALRVIAQTVEIETLLPILPTVKTYCMARYIAAAMKDFSKDEVNDILRTIGELPAFGILSVPIETDAISAKQQLVDFLRFKSLKRRAALGQEADLSNVKAPIGLISRDGTAMLGGESEAYLVGGTNGVLAQFLLSDDDSAVSNVANKWREAVCFRRKRLESLHIKFIQVVIPEKLSTYPIKFPYQVEVPSPPLRAVEHAFADNEQCESVYFSALRFIRESMIPDTVFGKFDTHLTTRAAHGIFTGIIGRLGHASPFALDVSDSISIEGDLSERFFGIALSETLEYPSLQYIENISGTLRCVQSQIPPEGHLGTRIVWSRNDAPINQCVIAFANSFFERGGSARSLSWWFARAFKEFHFIWSPDIDFDYVARFNPDVVICQTIERFLMRTPQDIGC